MIVESSYHHALKAFNKARTSVAQALRIAISAYEQQELSNLSHNNNVGFGKSEDGKFVVIYGFNSQAEANIFIKEVLHAQSERA